MILYFSLDANFESCTSIKAKIAKIDAILDSLFNTALKSVAAGNRVEYSIDTGQTKQRVVYATTKSVTDSITSYETIRQMYVSKLTGNEFRNVDQRNLKGGYYGY